jgi:hypothetical protein
MAKEKENMWKENARISPTVEVTITKTVQRAKLHCGKQTILICLYFKFVSENCIQQKTTLNYCRDNIVKDGITIVEKVFCWRQERYGWYH